MIELNKIKAAIFDYDDTLCIHTEHGADTPDCGVDSLTKGTACWDTCKKSVHMQAFIDLLKSRNVHLGMMSWCVLFDRMVSKAEWVKENYGVEMHNYCVGIREGKAIILSSLCEVLNIKQDEIILIDDMYKTLDEAASIGCQAASPMEVVNFVTENNLL